MLDPAATASFLTMPLPRTPATDLPIEELRRSRAAARVGELCAEAQIVTFHHEHRVRLPLPDAWLPRDGDVEPQWDDGVLAEPKYGAFRHDLPIASFNPGHRAKWAAHEGCHTLVGFAWHPGASALFLATAARLAELVPVVLWYFLDEIGLARCPRHDGPLFRGSCSACARAAASGPVTVAPELAEQRAAEAARFLDRELAAVAKTRRLGVPCPHVWGSIDLCSDGIAYAAGHGARLGSAAFARFVEQFPSPVLWSSLDDLEARVVEVALALGEGRALSVRRAAWPAMDLGQRLLDVWADTAGPGTDPLSALIDALATGLSPAEAYRCYETLHEEYELPSAQDVFAVGYDVPGIPGRSVEQIREGLGTAVPMTLTLCEEAGVDWVTPFVTHDRFVRAHLGTRFARWLTERHPGPAAELATYEAALRTAGGEASAVALGAGEGVRFAAGVLVHTFSFDVLRLAEQIDAGSVQGLAVEGGVQVPTEGEPTTLAVGRTAAGELAIAEIRPEVGHDPAVALPEERDALVELELVVADRWPI